MSKRLPALLVAVVALGATAAGCGSDEKATSNTTHAHMASTSMSSSGAADLRAGLTSLLTEHVYLAGIALTKGGPAVATLDDNSKALSKAIASVYGDDAGKQFLALWRKHIGFFVAYKKALV